MKALPARRFTLFVAALALTRSSSSPADHDLPCRPLPTSAQRPAQVSCNPQQKCLDAIHASGPARTAAERACRTLPTNGTCPGTETFNPRDECIRKLPKPPDVRIDSVVGNAFSSGDAIKNIRPDQNLVVRGKNVGMMGVKVRGEQGDFSISRRGAGLPGCDSPDCVALDVKGNAHWPDICNEAKSRRSFTITEAFNHNSARGSFRIAPNDIPQRQPSLPQAQTTTSIPYLQVTAGKRGTFGGMVAWGYERNAVTVKVPKSGQTKIQLRTNHDLVQTDVLEATVDHNGYALIRTRQGSRSENATRGGDVFTLFFEMWVVPPHQPCDPQPEGILQFAAEAETGASREKATAAYWVPPRGQ